MKKVLLIPAKAKSGAFLAAGTEVEVTFPKELGGRYVRMTAGDVSITGATLAMKRYFGTRIPSMKTLEKWVFDSVCKSVGGKDVEPDGWDCDGTPSWLLVIGVI